MDALTFISRMTADLAWPLAAVGLAILFRVPIGGAIDRINKLTAKAAGQHIVVEMEKLLRITPPPAPQNSPGREYPIAGPTPAVGPIGQVILDGPEKVRVVKDLPVHGTQVEAWWDTLNQELKRKGKSANAPKTRNLKSLASYLVDEKLLTPNFVPLYALLGRLHLSARKHPESVDTDAFRKTYDLLMGHLRQIGG
jgi:hypothetical protein